MSLSVKGWGFESSTDWPMTSWARVGLGFEAPFLQPNWSFIFKLFFFFWGGPFLKSVLNLLQYRVCFVLVFWPRGTWNRCSPTRDWTHMEGKVVTTESPGKSPQLVFILCSPTMSATERLRSRFLGWQFLSSRSHEGSAGKESAHNAGGIRDSGLIPGMGRSPGGGHGPIPSPVFLPGESQGQRSLVGYSPRGH